MLLIAPAVSQGGGVGVPEMICGRCNAEDSFSSRLEQIAKHAEVCLHLAPDRFCACALQRSCAEAFVRLQDFEF